MQLAKSESIIDRLSEFDDYFQNSGAQCWSTRSGNINLYLFSAFYPTIFELENNYKELRDHVAISFQGRTLQSAAERWNLYLLYLVKEKAPEELRQRIIQDKFSSRKIVHTTGEGLVNDGYIIQFISDTLLEIEIPSRQASPNSLELLMNDKHPNVAEAARRIGYMNSRSNISALLKVLKHEQNQNDRD